MIVDLDNTNKLYQAIPYHTTIYQVIPNISNCHKSVIFQTKYLKFSVEVDSNRPYHDILYHTLKCQITNISNCHNLVIFHTKSSKFGMVVDLHNTMPYYTIPYHTNQDHTISYNTKYFKHLHLCDFFN